MNLESLIEEIIELQYSYQGTLRDSKEHRTELKKIVCRALEEHCDDVWKVLDKHSTEWKETKGSTYNPFGPPGETPLVDRVIDLIINRTKKDLGDMEKSFKEAQGLKDYDC
jgi:hypothetical protein